MGILIGMVEAFDIIGQKEQRIYYLSFFFASVNIWKRNDLKLILFSLNMFINPISILFVIKYIDS